jgi:CHAD domain-containing protein
MALHKKSQEKGNVGLSCVLLEQAKKLCLDLRRANRAKAIHEAHKRCKRIRAIGRLLRPGAETFYQRENKAFRDLARSLSAMRDEDARLKAFAELTKLSKSGSREFSYLRDFIIKKDAQITETCRERKFAEVVRNANAAERRLKCSKLPEEVGFELIGKGIRLSYKRGRRAMSLAYKSRDELAFHEWRKRVKDLSYQLQIIQKVPPPGLKRLLDELDDLSDVLGNAHDLLLIHKVLRKRAERELSPEFLQAFVDLRQRRASELQAKARVIGRRVYDENSSSFIKWIKRMVKHSWQKRKNESPGPTV